MELEEEVIPTPEDEVETPEDITPEDEEGAMNSETEA